MLAQVLVLASVAWAWERWSTISANGNILAKFDTPKTFSEASIQCSMFNGGCGPRLAMPWSPAENQALKDLTASDKSWFGVTQSRKTFEPAGNWSFYQGSSLLYKDWAPGEPNNFNGTQDCAAVNASGWFDETCSERLPYICEAPYCPGVFDLSLSTTKAFMLVHQNLSWNAARTYCKALRYSNSRCGDLADLNSPTVEDVVTFYAFSSAAWFGLYHNASNSSWYTTTALSDPYPATYFDWMAGEPQLPAESCGLFVKSNESEHVINQWRSENCSESHYFICEVDLSFRACPPGWGYDSTSCECQACPLGTRPLFGMYTAYCEPCLPGSYSNSSASIACSTCPSGKYAGFYATSCLDCPYGSVSSPGSSLCTYCSPGWVYNESTRQCSSCSSGRFATFNTTSCQTCPPGRYSSAPSSSCSACFPGTFSNGTGLPCTSCPTGTFSQSNASVCSTCAYGSFSGPGSSLCSTCPPGTSYNHSLSTCDPCLAGFFSSTFNSSCQACNPGKFSFSNATSCIDCDKGKYSSASGSFSCLVCSEGTVAANFGQSACVACLPGNFSVSSSSSCQKCSSGKFAPLPSSTVCLICTSGSFSYSGQNSCTLCDPGTYSNTNMSSTCSSCNFGRYANSSGRTSCIACPLGYYGTGQRATSCLLCEENTYSSFQGLTQCFNCPSGKFSGKGATECTTCSQSSFWNRETSACAFCPFGKYFNATAVTSCQDCRNGTFSNSTGTTECVLCSPGRFSEATHGSSICLRCSHGLFSTQGSSTCEKCPEAPETQEAVEQCPEVVLEKIQPEAQAAGTLLSTMTVALVAGNTATSVVSGIASGASNAASSSNSGSTLLVQIAQSIVLYGAVNLEFEGPFRSLSSGFAWTLGAINYGFDESTLISSAKLNESPKDYSGIRKLAYALGMSSDIQFVLGIMITLALFFALLLVVVMVLWVVVKKRCKKETQERIKAHVSKAVIVSMFSTFSAALTSCVYLLVLMTQSGAPSALLLTGSFTTLYLIFHVTFVLWMGKTAIQEAKQRPEDTLVRSKFSPYIDGIQFRVLYWWGFTVLRTFLEAIAVSAIHKPLDQCSLLFTNHVFFLGSMVLLRPFEAKSDFYKEMANSVKQVVSSFSVLLMSLSISKNGKLVLEYILLAAQFGALLLIALSSIWKLIESFQTCRSKMKGPATQATSAPVQVANA